ncbi:hypothetical protein P885DRAFT_58795 [Corynascus similis CBS 632.67]
MAQQIPAAAPAEPKPTANPLRHPNLPTDPKLLRQTIQPAPSPARLRELYSTPDPQTLPSVLSLYSGNQANNSTAVGMPSPDPNNVLFVVPTANASKTNLFVSYLHATKPAHITRLTHRQIPAESGVGEQPYDGAGPRGALNRAVRAVRALLADESHRAAVVGTGVGTLLLCVIENFIAREPVDGTGTKDGEDVKLVPVDYGFIVLCRISLLDGTWTWEVGISRGTTLPREYWQAAEKFGFEDGEARTYGKVTVGELLQANIGLDKADWNKPLAGVSRYELLEEALRNMKVPWPEVAIGAGDASTEPATRATE